MKKRRNRKVVNWKEYNNALVQRGLKMAIFISEDRVKQWQYTGQQRPGGKQLFSNSCILDIMQLKELYNLAYRQISGLIYGFIQHVKGIKTIKLPQYSTVCKRASKLEVPKLKTKIKPGSTIAIDSTGLKVLGQGEWRDYKNKNGKKRWLKLHAIVDVKSGEVLEQSLTTDDVGDSSEMKNMLSSQDIPEEVKCLCDGGYDKETIWEIEDNGNLTLVIKPRKDSIENHKSDARNNTVLYIKEHGLEKWKYKNGYYHRGKVENTFMRLKKKNDGKMKYQNQNTQELSIYMQMKILNDEIKLGMPITELFIRNIAA